MSDSYVAPQSSKLDKQTITVSETVLLESRAVLWNNLNEIKIPSLYQKDLGSGVFYNSCVMGWICEMSS